MLKLVGFLGFDKGETYESNININKLNEFCCFRNELFHDRYNNIEQNYHHTKFSSNVYLLNQADVIQSLVISLEIFELFRYCFSNLDLMPSICLSVKDNFAYEKLDVLFEKLTLPCWFDVLNKHNLSTDIDTSLQVIPLPITSSFDSSDICVIIKAENKNKYDFELGETNICKNRFERFKDYYQVDEGFFKLPNYVRHIKR